MLERFLFPRNMHYTTLSRLSEEIFRTANSSYDAGELTYLEYLQAKQTLVGSKNNYNNALFDYYESLFKIEEIIGQNLTNK